jgi:HPt (histidine-containing phosphotransfer) domain-containing protein
MGATQSIRALPDPQKAALPVIALTGNVQDEDVRKCYAANMNGHLAKPIDPKKLVQQLQKVTDNELDNPVMVEAAAAERKGVRHIEAIELKPALSGDIPKEIAKERASEGDQFENAAPLQNFVDQEEEVPPVQAIRLDDEERNPLKDEAKDLKTGQRKDDVFQTDSGLRLDDGAKNNTATPESAKVGDNIDVSMLDHLKKSVGAEILNELLAGYIEKADEIVATIQALKGAGDSNELRARAHELKGMAGNFGIRRVSKIADTMEELSKQEQFDQAILLADELQSAQEEAKERLKNWV